MLGPGVGGGSWRPEREGIREDPFGEESPEAPSPHAEQEGAGGTLFGFSGSGLRSLGIVLIVAGLLVFLVGISYLFSGPVMPSFTGNFQQDQQAQQTWFQESTAHGIGAMVILAIGGILFSVGGYALRFGLIRPVASFVADEASPAIETASVAIGRGLAAARADSPEAAPEPRVETVVKIKCTKCGHLNEESAKFCDECGEAL